MISASIRVRSTSSGVQRWVLAVSSTSGAVRRTAASFSRRNPASRSAGKLRDRTVGATGRCCWCGLVAVGGHGCCGVAVGGVGVMLVGVQGSGRRDGQVERPARRRPGRGVGAPVPAARMERTSAARNRLNATARRSAATSASVPWAAPSASRISSSEPRRVLPIAAAPTRNASASAPRAQNCCSARGFRARPAAGRGPGPVVVGVEDRRLTGRDQLVFGHDHPGGGSTISSRAAVDDHAARWSRSAGSAPSSGPRRTGRRTAGRPCGSPAAARSPAAATATARSTSRSVTSRSSGTAADLRMHRGVDLRAPRRRGRVRRAHAHRPTVDRGLGEQRHHQVALRVAAQVLHDPLRLRVAGRGRSPGRTRNALANRT